MTLSNHWESEGIEERDATTLTGCVGLRVIWSGALTDFCRGLHKWPPWGAVPKCKPLVLPYSRTAHYSPSELLYAAICPSYAAPYLSYAAPYLSYAAPYLSYAAPF
jgi:hypothetical protein